MISIFEAFLPSSFDTDYVMNNVDRSPKRKKSGNFGCDTDELDLKWCEAVERS